MFAQKGGFCVFRNLQILTILLFTGMWVAIVFLHYCFSFPLDSIYFYRPILLLHQHLILSIPLLFCGGINILCTHFSFLLSLTTQEQCICILEFLSGSVRILCIICSPPHTQDSCQELCSAIILLLITDQPDDCP